MPKICLELGRGVTGMIGHTQPRRIAARSVAARIARSCGRRSARPSVTRFASPTHVAGHIRQADDRRHPAGRDCRAIGFSTATIRSSSTRRTSASLNIDFLLGYLKQLLPKRPDLKLIITSATIDPQRFSRHFGDAPILEVSGRTYPVETRYRPLKERERSRRRRISRKIEAILAAVDEVAREGPGDVLIFLPGEREIRETAEALREASSVEHRNSPAFFTARAEEQNKVFSEHQRRRIILATNVAETSLTVPGIRYVIDPGLARISRYNTRTKVQRLPIETDQPGVSANQRAGRCGRVGAGRLRAALQRRGLPSRAEFTEPEIQRTNLASVILQMKFLRLGDVAGVSVCRTAGRPQRDCRRPAARGARGALGERTGLTRRPAGRRRSAAAQVARRGCRSTPWLGRMILEAEWLGCLREVLVIEPGARAGPAGAAGGAAYLRLKQHARFKDEGSDFLTWSTSGATCGAAARPLLLGVPPAVQAGVPQLPAGAGVAGVREPARQVCREMRIEVGQPADTPDADGIHHALLSGLLSRIGLLVRDARSARSSGTGAGGPDRGPREYPGSAAPGSPSSPAASSRAATRRSSWPASSSRPVGSGLARTPRSSRSGQSGVGGDLVKRSLLRASLVEEARRRDDLREGDAVRRAAGRRPARRERPDSTPRSPGLHPACAGLRGVAHQGEVLRGGPATPRGGRGISSTGPGAGTWSSTSTPCSSSTPSGSARRSSAAPTSTAGGRTSAGPGPTWPRFTGGTTARSRRSSRATTRSSGRPRG